MVADIPAQSHAGHLARGLGQWIGWVACHPRLVLFVSLMLTIGSLGLAFTQLEYHTQRSDLMSAHKAHQQRWQAYIDAFGNDDDMVVVVEGRSPQRMREALEQIARGIHQHPTQFDRLFYKVDLRSLSNRAGLYLSQDELTTIVEKLQSMDILLGPLAPLAWQSLTLEMMVHQACLAVEQRNKGQPFRAADRQLIDQLSPVLAAARATLDNSKKYKNPWMSLLDSSRSQGSFSHIEEPRYFFSEDQRLAFLLVRPVSDRASFTPAREAVQTLRSTIAEVAHDYPMLRLGLTGLPVLENDEMVASEQDSQSAAVLALAGVCLLYLVVYRRWRSPALTVGTMVIGTIWALGWLTLTVGHLNILSATFAVMLIGIGDYGVLWIARYEVEQPRSADTLAALTATARQIGPSIATAALTTSLAFFATMLADFKGVAELGWIAGCGVLLCALSCFTVLPAMLMLSRRREVYHRGEVVPMSTSPARQRPAAWFPRLTRRPGWILGLTGVLLVVSTALASRSQYDPNLLHLQQPDLESVAWEKTLIEKTQGANWSAVSLTPSAKHAMTLKDQYLALPEVSQVVEVASLIPREQAKKMPVLASIHQRLEGLPMLEAIPSHGTPNPDRLLGLIMRLQDACRSLPQHLKPVRLLETQLEPFRRRLMLLPRTLVINRLKEFESRLTTDLAADLHQLQKVTTPEPVGIADLPDSLRERYIGKHGEYLVRAFARESLWEYSSLERFVTAVHQVDPNATGKPFSTLAGLRSMREGFMWAGVYALIAIVVVLAIDFRQLGDVLLALLPLAIGILLCLGGMVLLQIPFNPANLIALPLIVGVGVDHGVHVLHDFRTQCELGTSHYRLSWATGRGILVAALTTIIGFGTLIFAHHQGMSSLGQTLSLGVACSLFAALVVLPAVLHLLHRVYRAQLVQPANDRQSLAKAA